MNILLQIAVNGWLRANNRDNSLLKIYIFLLMYEWLNFTECQAGPLFSATDD